jgi:hypothetical protein
MNSFTTILASTVTTTVLIGAFTWLARTWIKERLSQSIKHEYDLDLEKYKSDLSATNSVEIEKLKARIGTEYEIVKASMLRYSEKQFELYNDLWASLCDLEISVKNLWETADITNLRKLSQQVHDTRLKIRKSALLIEDGHYKELNCILSEFESFQFGKQLLIDLRTANRYNDYCTDDFYIRNVISDNEDKMNMLVQLLSDMMNCLKRQIVNADESSQVV